MPELSSTRTDFDSINRLVTIEDHSSQWPVTPIGNAWSREYFGGPFFLFEPPVDRPAVSLVFVRTRDGNTGADDPASLGGGATDLNLIYEGLSRVAADAVLAGTASIGSNQLFTIHHPQLVELRLALGLPRHPTQIVISKHGNIDLSARLFSTPAVPVILLAGRRCEDVIGPRLRDRPWITIVATRDSLPDAFRMLRRDHKIARISAIGGRKTATSLVDAGLIQDLYLTTTAIHGGEPHTPWYVGGRAPLVTLILRKKEDAPAKAITFDHLALS